MSTRNRFDEQLEILNSHIIDMGTLIERTISFAAMALITQEEEYVQKTIAIEEEIDHQEKQIESLCMKLLLRQQPVASDLRLISSALKMITDMERIGDQARDIAEITTFLNGKQIEQIKHIPQMAEATIKMVTESVNAFVMRDLELALSVAKSDDIIDKLFLKVRDELIELIKIDSENGASAIDLLMIAKYFERIGDHAANIAEWVVYAVTGKHKNG